MRVHSQRGFTLIEMMISVVLGSLIVLAAVAFASHEVRTLARSSQVLEVSQVGRAVIDMIGDDLTNAGMGVGYRADGTFAGIQLGVTNRAGGTFVSNNRPVTIDGVATTTDDLVLALADGATSSIVEAPSGDLAGAAVTVCAPAAGEIGFNDEERVLVRDAFGLAATSYYIEAVGVTGCPVGVTCQAGGCLNVLLAADPAQWESDATASDADYARGQLIGNFRQVVWHVEPSGTGRLRRFTVTDDLPPPDCSGFACGAVVADGVESLQFRVRARNPISNDWTDLTAAPAINDNRALRVDIEIAMRARTRDINNQLHDAASLMLESRLGAPVCIPGGCAKTLVRREVFRTTVEIKNSGFMRLSGGAS